MQACSQNRRGERRHVVVHWPISAMHHLIKGLSVSSLLGCQMNELPLPSRGNASDALQRQCPPHESSFPSSCLLRLFSVCQRNKDNTKNYAWARTAILDCQESRTNLLFLLNHSVYQTKGWQTVNAVSFRCWNNFQTIHCSSTVVSIGSPTFLLCLSMNSQRVT